MKMIELALFTVHAASGRMFLSREMVDLEAMSPDAQRLALMTHGNFWGKDEHELLVSVLSDVAPRSYTPTKRDERWFCGDIPATCKTQAKRIAFNMKKALEREINEGSPFKWVWTPRYTNETPKQYFEREVLMILDHGRRSFHKANQQPS